MSDDISITIEVRYHGIKATQYFSKWTEESAQVFVQDLFVLKVPLPKRDNIQFVSYGCIQGFWPATKRRGVLHNHIIRCEASLDASNSQLSALSIVNFAAKYSDIGTLKRANQNAYDGRISKRPKVQDGPWNNPTWTSFAAASLQHPAPQILKTTRIPSSLPQWPPSNLPSSAAPLAGALPKVDAASTNLLHAENGPGVPVSKSIQAPPQRTANNTVAVRPLTSSESIPGSVPPSRPTATQSHDSVQAIPKATQPAHLPTPSASSQGGISPAPGEAQPAAQPTSHAKPPPILSTRQVLGLIEAAGGRSRMLPAEEQLLDFPEMANTPAMKSVISGLMMRARAIKVENLTRELRQIRRDRGEKQKEEVRALALLQRLDSRAAQALFPKTSTETVAQPTGGNDVQAKAEQKTELLNKAQEQILKMTAELQQERKMRQDAEDTLASIQQECEKAREKALQAETKLQQEQTERQEVEDAIQDIRRECRSPFIVPSLLDAFVELSRMTTRATINVPTAESRSISLDSTPGHGPEPTVKQEAE